MGRWWNLKKMCAVEWMSCLQESETWIRGTEHSIVVTDWFFSCAIGLLSLGKSFWRGFFLANVTPHRAKILVPRVHDSESQKEIWREEEEATQLCPSTTRVKIGHFLNWNSPLDLFPAVKIAGVRAPAVLINIDVSHHPFWPRVSHAPHFFQLPVTFQLSKGQSSFVGGY